MKRRFLNPDVEREVSADQTLFVAWGLTMSVVDTDIDPTHNPDWRAGRRTREAEHLAKLKGDVAALVALRASAS